MRSIKHFLKYVYRINLKCEDRQVELENLHYKMHTNTNIMIVLFARVMNIFIQGLKREKNFLINMGLSDI